MRRFARVALVFFAAAIAGRGLLPASARADGDDPGPGDWAAGADYEALGALPAVPGLFGYERSDWTLGEQPTEAAWLFVLRREGEPEAAYRVDAFQGESGGVHLTVEVLSKEDDGTLTAVHVGQARAESKDAAEAAVRAAVAEAEGAAADWSKAIAATPPPSASAASENDRERLQWKTLCRSLEAAQEAHPTHLGLFRDRVVAYSHLLALEAGSPTASTLSMLVPRTIAAWTKAAGGDTTDDDDRVARRALAALRLVYGPHVEVLDLVNQDPEDPELAQAKAVLDALGYESFEALDPVEVEGATLPCKILGRRATGAPKAQGVAFERLAFSVMPDDGSDRLDVAYVLVGTLEDVEKSRMRWALYGVAGSLRRCLRLYGATEPSTESVAATVRDLVTKALAPAEAPK